MQTSKECIMVFARAPHEGRVKTRLAADIGTKAAAGLYRAFVADLLQTLGRTDYPIHVHFTPHDAELQMKQWLGAAYEFVPQSDGGLGARMAAAFKHTFSNHFSRAVLIGVDLPDLPESIIHEAFDALLKNEAVLGPSHDGGYYLIGFNRNGFVPGVFTDIAWGTEHVFAETAQIFGNNNTSVHYLGCWDDIDTYADLLDFIQRQKDARGNVAAETGRFISELELSHEKIRSPL